MLIVGQTVEKLRVQPGKTVPRKLPRDSFSRLTEALPQLVRLCYPDKQSWTFKTLKSLSHKPKVAFKLSLGNSLKNCGFTAGKSVQLNFRLPLGAYRV